MIGMGSRFSDSSLEALANQWAGDGEVTLHESRQCLRQVLLLRVFGVGLDVAANAQGMIVYMQTEAIKTSHRHCAALCSIAILAEGQVDRLHHMVGRVSCEAAGLAPLDWSACSGSRCYDWSGQRRRRRMDRHL